MNLPLTMTGHDRAYRPPRSLRDAVGAEVTAWDLFRLEHDEQAGPWASATLTSVVAAADAEGAGVLGCTECVDTGFYGRADVDNPDLLLQLVRRTGDAAAEALTAAGMWEPWDHSGALEVLDSALAGDLAAAITDGACGLLRLYGQPRAFLPPCGGLTASALGSVLVLSADAPGTPQGMAVDSWTTYAVVPDEDPGAVLDLVRFRAGEAERWDEAGWTPDTSIWGMSDVPAVELSDHQLKDVLAQMQPTVAAGDVPKDLRPQKCKYCETPATKSILHSEGMAYIPVCGKHLAKGKTDAAACAPFGDPDPSNIDGIRDIVGTALVADAPLIVSPDPRAERLRRYWSTGRGGAKIRWTAPGNGDWYRCVRHLSKYMGLRAKGYCSNLHKRNTGVWPGDRRNRGLHASVGSPRGSPESALLAAVQSRRMTGTTEGTNAMPTAMLTDGVYTEADIDNEKLLQNLTAAAIPVAPPDDWFEDPHLTKPTTLTITDEGQVFGHLAPWGVSHIGMAGSTKAPHNRSGKYAYFRTGQLVTASGKNVRVGQLTVAGGHASTDPSVTTADAVKHYDDTASGVADIAVGEDAHGIWAAGALRPHVTPEQVRVMRACPPSGDWRVVNGNLEMVAACHVNVQGFPIAAAGYQGGAITALVAAGAREMAELLLAEHADQAMVARLSHLESMVASLVAAPKKPGDTADQPGGAANKSVEEAADEAEDKADSGADEAAEGEPTEAEKARAQKISHARASIAQAKRAALRKKVGVSAAGSPMSMAERKSKSTISGTDSFPIGNVADLKNAIQAFGRAGDKPAAKKHIISMAYKLKRPDLIPENWSTK